MDNDKEFAEVTASLYDDDNTDIGTANTFTKPSNAPPGEPTPSKTLIDSKMVFLA